MPYENMTEREMLVELMEDKKRRDRFRYVKIAAAVLILILIIVFAVKFLVPMTGYVKSIEESMTGIQAEVDAIKGQAQTLMEDMQSKLDEMDLESLQELSDKLQDVDMDSVKETVEKLGNLVNKFPWLFR